MAYAEKMVPILLKWEAGVNEDGLSNREAFEKARKKGYSNDPSDSGGPTMIGVTLDTYKKYCKEHGMKTPGIAELKAIKYDDWYEIFKSMYWDAMRADEIINQSIANLCVNSVWGSGKGYIKKIQNVLGVTADGIVGPKTLAKINEWKPQSDLFTKLVNRRKSFFYSIAPLGSKNRKWLNGWLRRLNSFEFVEQGEESTYNCRMI